VNLVCCAVNRFASTVNKPVLVIFNFCLFGCQLLFLGIHLVRVPFSERPSRKLIFGSLFVFLDFIAYIKYLILYKYYYLILFIKFEYLILYKLNNIIDLFEYLSIKLNIESKSKILSYPSPSGNKCSRAEPAD